jgi:hypothetical protein
VGFEAAVESLLGCRLKWRIDWAGALRALYCLRDTCQRIRQQDCVFGANVFCYLARLRAQTQRAKGGEEGETAHINHMKLLPDIRARLPTWTGLSDQRCGAVRCGAVRCNAMRCDCGCDLMLAERWDQLTSEGCCRFGLA